MQEDAVFWGCWGGNWWAEPTVERKELAAPTPHPMPRAERVGDRVKNDSFHKKKKERKRKLRTRQTKGSLPMSEGTEPVGRLGSLPTGS